MNPVRVLVCGLCVLLVAGCAPETRPADDTSSPLHKFSETFASYDPGGHVVQSETKVEGTLEYFEHDMSRWFQTARCDTEGYTLKLPNGTYHALLYFSEVQLNAPGERVFGVTVQGHRIVERLDIFSLVGKNKAYQVKSPDVKVTNGLLRIHFPRIVGAPCIAAISVYGDIEGARDAVERIFGQHIDSGGPGDYGIQQGIHSP